MRATDPERGIETAANDRRNPLWWRCMRATDPERGIETASTHTHYLRYDV